jgi:Zn-dependent M28 family amino/carboxypeptidase
MRFMTFTHRARAGAALWAALALLAGPAPSAAAPPIHDADTRAWWALTTQLAGDSMEGRDTGSPAYARAARIVARRFARAGLKPAGDNGTFFQSVPLHEVRVESGRAEVSVVRGDGSRAALKFLHQISVRPTDALPPTLNAPLVFRGYCSPAEVGEARGRVVVCFGTRRNGLPSAAERLRAVAAAGAVGLINVDDPGFTLEPPRWPAAYARTVELRGSPAPAAPSLAVMTLSADAFAAAIAGAGQDAAAILNAGAAKQALPAFDIPARLTARFPTTVRDYTSDNVLALLPGSDPALKAQVVVVSAHLDGYGFGEPVDGQSLYHGAFDDAAYVASLVRLADRRHGRPLKRGLLFAAFTGEEKGLLGSNWFVRHRAPAGADLVADINLDQLRPLFPLKILTIEALGDTSLGDTARTLAEARGVEARPDLEPERNLVRRADSWPFLAVGIPAVGFVFGYDPGTPSEAIYRDWYARRYHRPLDSLATPFDAKAAADFNCFFYDLAETVADAPERPAWKPGSELRPKPAGGT